MKQVGKWTFLFILFAVLGFGVTLLAANGVQMAQLLAEDSLSADSFSEEALSSEVILPEGDVMVEQTSFQEETTTVATLSDGESVVESANTDAASDLAGDVVAQGLPGQPLSAVGTIELNEDRQVVLATSGRIDEIAVEVGDLVGSGDLLIALDTTYLDWSLEQAEIGFETARINFEELGDEIEESDIAVAEANLLLAQENLAVVEAGPTEEALAATRSRAAAAWSAYEELQKEPTQAQINQAQASLKKAEIKVEQAQREFDKIAWLPEAAASEAADNLQSATVDLEAAKAAFEEANKPATESELQSALGQAQSAQDALNELLKKPTAAELADAKADVASAENTLQEVQKGPKDSELRKSELSVREAMIELEQARLDLDNARVTAPIDGTVLSVDVDLGQQASAGTVVAILADTHNVQLVVNVEQKDISRIQVGLAVDVSVFALPNVPYQGVVDKIAPIANSGTGFVTFPVIINLTDGELEQLLPGMTATAIFAPNGVAEVEEDGAVEDDTEASSEEADTAEPENAEETPEASATAEPAGGSD